MALVECIMIMISVLVLACALFSVNAFVNWPRRPKISTSTLGLFNKKGGAKASKVSSLGRESVNNYLDKFGSSKNKLKDPDVLQANFQNLAKAVRSDEAAAEIVSVWPEVLCVAKERVSGNMDTFTEYFEFEGALGMVTRNPNLFAVPTEGYGSARAACEKGGGKDMMAMSYVIATTRPIGTPLLGLLGLLLLKAAVFGPGTTF